MVTRNDFSTNSCNFKLVGPPTSSGPWERQESIEFRQGKKCFEFSWDKTGGLYFLIGFIIGDTIIYYYQYNNIPYFIEYSFPSHYEIYRREIGIDSLGNEIMICADSSEKSLIVINKNEKYKYIGKEKGTFGNLRISI